MCYFHGLQVDVGYGESKNTTYVGSNKARIGRNMRPPKDEELKSMEENLLSPNPRQISKELFTRKEGFIPATTINLLAAAWLQAQNHDWFSHGKNVATRPSKKNGGNQLSEEQKKMFDPILVPPVPGDDLFPHGMLAPRTRPDFSQTPQPGYFPRHQFPVSIVSITIMTISVNTLELFAMLSLTGGMLPRSMAVMLKRF